MCKWFAVVLLLVSQSGWAGSVADAKVVYVRVDESGRGMVVFDKELGGRPDCIDAVNYTRALSFDSKTSGGRAILATVLFAKATNMKISAYGTGSCTLYGGHVEGWSYGVLD